MRLYEVTESTMRFYHGTSSNKLPTIQRQGLVPQSAPESAMRGNWSTIPGYTERMVFLTPLAREAMFYAKQECDKIGGDPILLAVTLRPTDPLRVSDDYIIRSVVHAVTAKSGHPPLTDDDYDEDGDLDFAYSDTAAAHHKFMELLADHREQFYSGQLDKIADTPETLEALEAGYTAYQKALHTHWQASAGRGLVRDPAVAFEGTIPPNRIEVVDAKAMRRAGQSLKNRRRSSISEATKMPRVLYHGAPLGAIISIFDSDFVSAEDGYVSFTTNYQVATSFAHDDEHFNYGAVLVFNGDALNRLAYNTLYRYRDPILVDPAMRTSGFKTESEWRTSTDILHMKTALLSINADPAHLQQAQGDRAWLMNDSYLSREGIAAARTKAMLAQILRSPLLNKIT